MELRDVEGKLQDRVIRWFDYLWGAKKGAFRFKILIDVGTIYKS